MLDAPWPEAVDSYLVEDQVTYPVSFNGKVRFKIDLASKMSPKEVEEVIRADERTLAQLDGKAIRRVIVVPSRIVNVVM